MEKMAANKAPSKQKVIYLTGSTGFLGGFLVRELQADATVAKIYCPVRGKKGLSGSERFQKCFPFASYNKCNHLGMEEPLPDDASHVILNAYNTRFDEDIRHKLQENVVPILRVLDECRQRMTLIRGISLVSTAYVQPHKPFRHVVGGRLPFLLLDYNSSSSSQASNTPITATEVFDKLMAGSGNTPSVHEIVPGLHPYYSGNNYILSKHILEHLLVEKYAELPICIVRPSLIIPPRTVEYGLDTKAAIPLFMQIAPHPVLLAPHCEGALNVVFIEHVATDVLLATFQLAKPAASAAAYNNNNPHTDDASASDGAALWHPIIEATGFSNISFLDFSRRWFPHVPRMDLRVSWLRNTVRSIEFLCAMLLFGPKASKLLRVIYQNYDFFMAHTWDFKPRYTEDPRLHMSMPEYRQLFQDWRQEKDNFNKTVSVCLRTHPLLLYWTVAFTLITLFGVALAACPW